MSMNFAAKCTCGKSAFYCIEGCPRPPHLPNLQVYVRTPFIDWDQIERDYSAMVHPNSHTFNWFKEQVSKYIQ